VSRARVVQPRAARFLEVQDEGVAVGQLVARERLVDLFRIDHVVRARGDSRCPHRTSGADLAHRAAPRPEPSRCIGLPGKIFRQAGRGRAPASSCARSRLSTRRRHRSGAGRESQARRMCSSTLVNTTGKSRPSVPACLAGVRRGAAASAVKIGVGALVEAQLVGAPAVLRETRIDERQRPGCVVPRAEEGQQRLGEAREHASWHSTRPTAAGACPESAGQRDSARPRPSARRPRRRPRAPPTRLALRSTRSSVADAPPLSRPAPKPFRSSCARAARARPLQRSQARTRAAEPESTRALMRRFLERALQARPHRPRAAARRRRAAARPPPARAPRSTPRRRVRSGEHTTGRPSASKDCSVRRATASSLHSQRTSTAPAPASKPAPRTLRAPAAAERRAAAARARGRARPPRAARGRGRAPGAAPGPARAPAHAPHARAARGARPARARSQAPPSRARTSSAAH
jgi:hypothetical protein